MYIVYIDNNILYPSTVLINPVNQTGFFCEENIEEAVRDWINHNVSREQFLQLKDNQPIVDICILNTDTEKVEHRTVRAIKRPYFSIDGFKEQPYNFV